MPGNVGTSTATVVMPHNLSSAWGEGFSLPVVESGDYPDGSSQRRYDASGWRREWRLTRRLTWSEFTTLRTFWGTVHGAMDAFYFYPRVEHYDPTGASVTGRFKCKFRGRMVEQYDIGRLLMSLELIQVP